MTLIRRNVNAVLTLVLIVCNHAHGTSARDLQNGGGQLLTPTTKGPRPPPFAPMHVQADADADNNGGPHARARTISVNTNNLNNLLNKNPAQSLNDAVNSQGIVSSINAIKTDLDNLSQQFNIFNFIDIFINQTRQSIPLMATKGNFTLLQAALLCAVGSMTAGAAIIAAEAFYFRKHNEQEFYYHLHEQEHAQHAHAQAQYGKLPSLTYGAMHKSALERSDEDGAAVPKVRELQGRSQSLPGGSSTMSPEKLAEYYQRELKRMNKPQSLKRNQRRRQRKNKNSPNMMGGTRPGVPAPNGRARVKRQTSGPAGAPMPPDRPNFFNQFLLHPGQRSDHLNETDTAIEQATPPQTPSSPTQPPVFWGPRAPQQPLPLPIQQKRPEAAELESEILARPQPSPDIRFPLIPRPNPSGWSSMFDFISMLKNAMDYFMNYMFGRNGGHATSQNQRLGFSRPSGRVKREANETDPTSFNQSTTLPHQQQSSESPDTEIQAPTPPPPDSMALAPTRNPAPSGISSWLPKLDYVSMFKNVMTFLLNFIFEQNGGYASKLNLGSGFGQQQSPLGLRFPKLNPNRSFIPKVWGNNIRKS